MLIVSLLGMHGFLNCTLVGPTGDKGEKGMDGWEGPTGAPGAGGDGGAHGTDGVDGDDGTPGTPGQLSECEPVGICDMLAAPGHCLWHWSRLKN